MDTRVLRGEDARPCWIYHASSEGVPQEYNRLEGCRVSCRLSMAFMLPEGRPRELNPREKHLPHFAFSNHMYDDTAVTYIVLVAKLVGLVYPTLG